MEIKGESKQSCFYNETVRVIWR